MIGIMGQAVDGAFGFHVSPFYMVVEWSVLPALSCYSCDNFCNISVLYSLAMRLGAFDIRANCIVFFSG